MAAAQAPPPASPEEIRDMAAYFGIDLKTECFLISVAKIAVEAALPLGWTEQRDQENDRSVFVDPTGAIHEHHPRDDEFKKMVQYLC
jgi:hypothetical protein